GSNAMGRVGATFAEALLQVFGLDSLLVPLVFGAVGWQRFRRRSAAASYGGLLGYTLLLPSLCALLHLMYREVAFGGENFPPGGFVGAVIAGGLRALLNGPGALVV